MSRQRISPARRRGAVAVLLAVVLLVAGCASLPRSGPVTASDPDLPAPQPVGFLARGPQPGASPEEIVEGFLAASAAGYSDDFVVARTFLTGAAADTWQPLAQVRVYDEEPELTRGDDGGVHLSVGAAASVDGAGRYTEASEDATIDADFTLARNAQGEWRIAGLDDGVLLSAANFSSIYTESALYFLTPDRQALVPETRWFPQENLATSLVSALLEGPSPWLEPGVATAVPVGTRMVVESVTVTDGVARVDLSADSLSADGRERALLYAQVQTTLGAVAEIQDVEITAAGAPFEVSQTAPDLSSYPYTSGATLAVSEGTLVDVSGGEATPRPGSDLLSGMDLHDPAVGYEGQTATTAVLDGNDRLISAPPNGDQPIMLAEGTNLVAPSVDRFGWVWTTPTQNEGSLLAVLANGDLVDVAASWLEGGQVRAVRVSRDGARMAVAWVENNGDLVLDLASVVRTPNGVPQHLGEPVRVGENLSDVTDLAWTEENTLAALGTSSLSPEPAVHLVHLGGPTEVIPAVEGVASLTAGRGERSLVLATAGGQLYERNGPAWRLVHSGATDPALPG
ncbi:LpqB family beta-propeller domain-containing protein [Georgenia deserti]|uniref:LpqB family beta-propeller domain-containing protein n=1 Tax=Georgenia deserti TaxID=2093781 RepID=A0ABW4L130_9MICO